MEKPLFISLSRMAACTLEIRESLSTSEAAVLSLSVPQQTPENKVCGHLLGRGRKFSLSRLDEDAAKLSLPRYVANTGEITRKLWFL